jgi:hypothetical protein
MKCIEAPFENYSLLEPSTTFCAVNSLIVVTMFNNQRQFMSTYLVLKLKSAGSKDNNLCLLEPHESAQTNSHTLGASWETSAR